MTWELRRDIVDVGMTTEYEAYFYAHPSPWFIGLGEPTPNLDDEDGV